MYLRDLIESQLIMQVKNVECNVNSHVAAVNRTIVEEDVHFLWGSGPQFATNESVVANSLGRIVYHCCVGPDSLYELVRRSSAWGYMSSPCTLLSNVFSLGP